MTIHLKGDSGRKKKIVTSIEKIGFYKKGVKFQPKKEQFYILTQAYPWY